MIIFPVYPSALKSPKTNVKQLAQECTALLALDARHSFEWLTEQDRKDLNGTPLCRRNVLYKNYLFSLEEARLDALASGLAEPGILPSNVLEALSLSPLDRLDGKESRALRDAIGVVKRLDDEAEKGELEMARAGRKTSKGRSASKTAKSARDKEIRAAMQSPKGAKPQGFKPKAA